MLPDDGVNRYVWGPNGLAYAVDKTAADRPYVCHADEQGSVRAITQGDVAAGQSATVLQTYRYDEFENILTSTSSGLLPGNTFGYTGEQSDSVRNAGNLINLRSRLHSPDLGRFLQRDRFVGSLVRPQSLNRYAYVENNPLKFTDPTGRSAAVYVDKETAAQRRRRGPKKPIHHHTASPGPAAHAHHWLDGVSDNGADHSGCNATRRGHGYAHTHTTRAVITTEL
ncbi:MAG: RHS repeat-associated core domain-containing protein [Chloroflexota bacterium]